MQCKRCKNKTRLPNHKFCSKECYWKSLEGLKGKNAPNYKKVVGKCQVHKWLDVHFGKPKICEMSGCEGKCVWYDWAKKTGYEYERKRKNFFRLCRSCHRRYDLTPRLRIMAIKNLSWANGKSKTKLNQKQVAEIRRRIADGETMNSLGKEFGVDRNNIRYIRDYKIWKK